MQGCVVCVSGAVGVRSAAGQEATAGLSRRDARMVGLVDVEERGGGRGER